MKWKRKEVEELEEVMTFTKFVNFGGIVPPNYFTTNKELVSWLHDNGLIEYKAIPKKKYEKINS